MFPRLVLAALSCAVILFVSCGGSSGPSADQIQNPAVVDVSKPTGVVLVQDAGLWTIDADTAKWKAGLTLGEVVYWGGQSKTALIEKTGDRDFVSVTRSDGTEGWVIKIQIAGASVPGVVTAEKTLLYTQPKNANVSSKGLARGVILAVANEGGADNFAKVSVYDPASKTYVGEQYLRKEDISVSESDVQSAILLSLASIAKTDDQKKALLGSALKDYQGSQFASDIERLLNPELASGATAPGIVSESYTAQLNTLSPDTRVYASPVEGARVVGTLLQDTVLQSTERTLSGGDVVLFYRIADPVEGWVSQADVELLPNN